MTIKPAAIDPPLCSCATCGMGVHVPLDAATDQQMLLMVLGKVQDRTGVQFIYRNGVLSYHQLEWQIAGTEMP